MIDDCRLEYIYFMKIGQPKLSETKSEARRPRGAASRGGSFLHIAPLDPDYKAGLAGHDPAKEVGWLLHRKYCSECDP